jgi:hypothetical protein
MLIGLVILILCIWSVLVTKSQITSVYNVRALQELKATMISEEAYYAQNSCYTDVHEELKLYQDEKLPKKQDIKIFITLEDPNKQRYSIIAYHPKGDKQYSVHGPGGFVDGEPK